MSALTIFFGNNEQPLYVRTEQAEDFLKWFREASLESVYTVKGTTTYHILKAQINYVQQNGSSQI